jgi:hypothetical protein
MTHENMSLFDAIHSQRAIRHFSAQPVSDEAVETMLHAQGDRILIPCNDVDRRLESDLITGS